MAESCCALAHFCLFCRSFRFGADRLCGPSNLWPAHYYWEGRSRLGKYASRAFARALSEAPTRFDIQSNHEDLENESRPRRRFRGANLGASGTWTELMPSLHVVRPFGECAIALASMQGYLSVFMRHVQC